MLFIQVYTGILTIKCCCNRDMSGYYLTVSIQRFKHQRLNSKDCKNDHRTFGMLIEFSYFKFFIQNDMELYKSSLFRFQFYNLFLIRYQLQKPMKKIVFALATLYAVECNPTGCHYVPPPPACNGDAPSRSRRSVPSPPKVHVNIPKFPNVPKPNPVPSVSIPDAPSVHHSDRPSIDLSYSNTLRRPESPDAPNRPSRPNPRMPRPPNPSSVTVEIRENSTGRKPLSPSTRPRRSTRTRGNSRSRGTSGTSGSSRTNSPGTSGTSRGNSNTRGNSRSRGTSGTSGNSRTNSPGTSGTTRSNGRDSSRPRPPVVCPTAPKPFPKPAPKPVHIPGHLGCSTCGACGTCACH